MTGPGAGVAAKTARGPRANRFAALMILLNRVRLRRVGELHGRPPAGGRGGSNASSMTMAVVAGVAIGAYALALLPDGAPAGSEIRPA